MNAPLSKQESAKLEEKVYAIDAGLKALDDLGLSMVLKPDAITWNGKVHPIADVFPPLDKKELRHMAKSIKEIGLQEPVVLTPDGTLLDGRNRIAACKLAGVEVQFRVCDTDDPLQFVLAMNITRRHLTASQRAMIGADLAPYFKDAARKRQAHGKTAPGRTLSANRREVKGGKALANVVVAMNEGCAKGAERVSLRMVERAARVKKANPDLAERVLAGTMTLGAAEQQITKTNDVGQPEAKTKSEYVNVDVQGDEDDEREEWLERGRALAAKDRKAQLALSDWIDEGLLTLDLMRQMFEHVEWEFLVHIDKPKIIKSLRKQRTVWSKLIKLLDAPS